MIIDQAKVKKMASLISAGISSVGITGDVNKTVGSQSSDEDAASLLEHVKSTLLMYLKKCPLIDEANESLLGILYSMMKVSKED